MNTDRKVIGRWKKPLELFSGKLEFNSGCCCLLVKLWDWGLMTRPVEKSSEGLQFPRQNDHLKPDSPKLGSAPSCPTTSGGLSDSAAWSGRKCLTTTWESHHVSGSKKMVAVVASGKTHQPSPVITESQVWSWTQTQDVKVLFHKNHGKPCK